MVVDNINDLLKLIFTQYIEGKLVDKSGAEFDYASTAAGKIKGLFFAAQWCPYSRCASYDRHTDYISSGL